MRVAGRNQPGRRQQLRQRLGIVRRRPAFFAAFVLLSSALLFASHSGFLSFGGGSSGGGGGNSSGGGGVRRSGAGRQLPAPSPRVVPLHTQPPRADKGGAHDALPAENWALDVSSHQRHATSSGEQDGALEFVFDVVGHGGRFFVEFGYASQTRECPGGCNSYNLFKNHGWTGLLMDAKFENASINLRKQWVRPGNVVDLFREYGVPREPDLLSVDIDNADLWVLRALLDDGGWRPRVVSVEYNCVYPLEAPVANHWRTPWLWDRMMGASLSALTLVANTYGYSLVDVVHCLDLVFVRDDLLQGSRVPPPEHWRRHTNVTAPSKFFFLQKRVEDRKRFSEGSLVDVAVWLDTGGDEEEAARSAARLVEELGVQL